MVSSLNSLAVNSLSSVVVLFLQFMWCFLNSLWQRWSPNMQTLLVRWATVKGNCLSIEQYTRTKLIQDNFRADFWDRSWGPPSQLLAQFFFLSPVAVPEVFAKVNSAHYFWFLIWWMGATPPCQVCILLFDESKSYELSTLTGSMLYVRRNRHKDAPWPLSLTSAKCMSFSR